MVLDHKEDKKLDSILQKKKKNKPIDEKDYYAVLGLEDLRHRATLDHIKKAYKESCLTWHPDRNIHNGKADDTMFKAVQRANEILTNERTRRLHDSDIDFDDAIPPYADEKSFCTVYGPVFERWKIWCKLEMPSLGDETTKREDVDKFYRQWERFTSWRDFSFHSEHDLTKAEGRDERRWMEKENEKAGRTYKKKEAQKIANLLDWSKKADPRLKGKRAPVVNEQKKKLDPVKEAEEKQRVALVKEKEAARLQKIEDDKKAEKDLKVKEALAKKEALQKIENSKIRFRNVCRPFVILKGVRKTGINGEEVEVMISKLTIPDLDDFSTDLEYAGNDETTFVTTFNELMDRVKKGVEGKDKKVVLEKMDRPDRPVRETPVLVLEKEVVKEVPKEKESDWTIQEITNLTKALKLHITGKDRWQNISKAVGTKSVEEVQKRVAEMKKNVQETLPTDNHFDKFQQTKENKLDKGKVSDDLKKKAEDISQNYEQIQWTPEEQKKFESGLKTHGGDDKWIKISAMLDGKTPEDCKARFVHCKELALKKKQAKK
jgi:DnaJ family protein C protein 2